MNCTGVLFALSVWLMCGHAIAGEGVLGPKVLRVGPALQYTTVAAAARAASDGDIVEIQAGEYRGDVAVWTQKKLTIRGVNGRARLIADGAAAEGKGTWVIRDGAFTIENIEFSGSSVADRNGAGIRFEKGYLIVRNCVFKQNETGILTGGDKNSELQIVGSEFGYNGAGDGQSHNLYVGALRKLTVTASYFHHANIGHLLKSRASESHILYNRLTDEADGNASYELEFPSGGVAYVIGNVMQQGPRTDNPVVVSFGTEGYLWPRNELYLINNTLVNDRARGGTFLTVKSGASRIKIVNNVLIGKGTFQPPAGSEFSANSTVARSDVALAAQYDYRLKARSGFVGKAVNPGRVDALSLRPHLEYVHPARTRSVTAKDALNPGAFQTLVP